MKSRHILLAAICVIAMALGGLFAVALRKHNAERTKIERIPEIILTTIDGEEFSLAEMNPGRKVAILFFSPDCEFCRKEVEGIIASKDSFVGVEWVFVTIAPHEELDIFLQEYPLNAIEDTKICIEEFPELFLALDVTAPPSIFIYNSDGHIEHYKRGAVSIRTILEWLK